MHMRETSRTYTVGKRTPSLPCPSFLGSRTSVRRVYLRFRALTPSPLPAATFKIRRSTSALFLRDPVAHLQAIVTAKGVDNQGLISVKVFSQVKTLAITQVRDRTALIDRLPLKCKQCNSQFYAVWTDLQRLIYRTHIHSNKRNKYRYRNAWSQSTQVRIFHLPLYH